MSYDMTRFLNAQDSGVYEMALREMRTGQKRSHWMWFIFPQIEGLGWSLMAKKYEFASIDEAREYLENETLRARLLEISNVVYNLKSNSISFIFWEPDDLKFMSCMTLFYLITKDMNVPEYDVFKKNLDKYYDGQMCQHTLSKFEEANR